ncbi:MAG: CDP-alcohol phosphatidyltransferase family protein [Patescibacteria group bacterium]
MSNRQIKIVDVIWQKTLFRILPEKITPNFFTVVRLLLIPTILVFLALENFILALVFFVLAAVVDTIDGALARYRKQTSFWGTWLDPLADKLLVVLVVLFLFYYYPYPALLVGAIFFDLLLGLGALAFLVVFRNKEAIPANWLGKSKMVLAVAGVLLVFVYLISGQLIFLWLSVVILFLAIIFGALSFIVYGLKAMV